MKNHIKKHFEVLKTYIREEGQETGSVSGQMALASIDILERNYLKITNDFNTLPGAIRIHKYAEETWICDCAENVRIFIRQHYTKQIARYKASHPKRGTYISFKDLRIIVWNASYTDGRLGRYKTVYAESFEEVVVKLVNWIAENVLN